MYCGRELAISLLGVLSVVASATASRAATISTTNGDEGVTTDAFDVHQGTLILNDSGVTFPADDALGGVSADPERTHCVFSDNPPPAGFDFIDFKTPRPVTVVGYKLLLEEDSPLGDRSTKYAGLFAYDPTFTTLTQLSAVAISTPFAKFYGTDGIRVTDTFAPVTAQRWRLEVIRSPGPHLTYGSRVVELDAISPTSGDANGDGDVDFADLLTLARNYGKRGAGWIDGDFNGDGTVGFDDLVTLARHYDSGLASAVAAEPATTPEPGTSLVWVCLAATVLFSRQKRAPQRDSSAGRRTIPKLRKWSTVLAGAPKSPLDPHRGLR